MLEIIWNDSNNLSDDKWPLKVGKGQNPNIMMSGFHSFTHSHLIGVSSCFARFE